MTEGERIILENIDKKYLYILRHKNNKLALYEKEPIRKGDSWWGIWVHLNGFNHLFKFITWQDDEPYNIEELLKGE